MNRPRRGESVVDAATQARVRHLVAVSVENPLAPFALRPEKSYVFSPDGAAAVGYRVRCGVAMAAGDPIGATESWAAAISAFVAHARANHLRFAVLGCGEAAKRSWAAHGLAHVPIGRDVVLEQTKFTLEGRQFRNVRQAIKRSRNAGVTVTIRREGELSEDEIAELRALMHRSHRDDKRGFSMILGRMFDGSVPDAVIPVARDASGAVIGAQRYLWAGHNELSLDLPIRSPNSPNGMDERLSAEVVAWGAEHGVERVSLAFAPFPELFTNKQAGELGVLGKIAYAAVHLIDPLIKVERLYRYLRKFHAFDQERYVMLRWRDTVRVALAALLLEFGK
jgi:lysylphosphatidylglycerol synthetase-like protein (DUF2156 family)